MRYWQSHLHCYRQAVFCHRSVVKLIFFGTKIANKKYLLYVRKQELFCLKGENRHVKLQNYFIFRRKACSQRFKDTENILNLQKKNTEIGEINFDEIQAKSIQYCSNYCGRIRWIVAKRNFSRYGHASSKGLWRKTHFRFVNKKGLLFAKIQRLHAAMYCPIF